MVSKGGKHPAFRQGDNGATGSGAFTPLPPLWVRDSCVNPCAILTQLQPLHGKQTSNESEKAHPNEEARAYERARQQNAREEFSRWKGKGKGKDVPPKNPTPSTSERPAHLPATSSRPPPPSRALPPNIRSWTELAARNLEKWAQKGQAQEKVAIQEHRRLVQEASKVKMFNCVICMDSYIMDFSARVRSCGHVLCRDCMKEHVQSQVAQSIWPIRCPTCVADHSRTEDHGG